jgi:hypothetical protein
MGTVDSNDMPNLDKLLAARLGYCSLAVKVGKIFQNGKTQALAFFRMKLERMDIFVMDS